MEIDNDESEYDSEESEDSIYEINQETLILNEIISEPYNMNIDEIADIANSYNTNFDIINSYNENIDQIADMVESYNNNVDIEYSLLTDIEDDEIIDLSGATCHICLCDENDKKVLDKSINNLKEIPDNSIFASPCKEHFICKECFVRIALDFENHPINSNHSLIRCLYSEKDCANEDGYFTYFNNEQVKRILNEEQYSLYLNHAERYNFPGFSLETCPAYYCRSKNLISNEEINTTPIGKLIIECHQSIYCDYRYCYNCKKYLENYQAHCTLCTSLDESNNPHSYNYFLIKKNDNMIITSQADYLYKQKEITVEMAVNHIKNILYDSDPRFSLQCPVCLNRFYKSEKCAGMRHCGIERCYSCGKIQDEFSQELNDHWSEIGNRGCPRFDNAYYWNEIANCNFKCSENLYEGSCYNHDLGECTNYKHENGISNMVNERKEAFIYNFLKSLLKDLRTSVLKEMEGILDVEFIKKVFLFLDENKQYNGDYTPIVFLDKMNI